jgi:3-methyl-2-oxobutanoate hydroxymethyltransferase
MPKVTRSDLARMKADHKKIVVVTAYDFAAARLLDGAGVDVLLVGDSLGNVIQGHDTTLPVTLEHVLYHTACVARARPAALIVADLPFGTFQRGAAAALDASIRLVQEAGAEGVKLEGAADRLAALEAIARADIPVWAHLGLTPQSIHAFGGYRVQGRDEASATRMLEQARQTAQAGASALVLECVPQDLAREITAAIPIPTIGIGAGPHCDGQVLVFHDLLGFFDDFVPKFVKQYAHVGDSIQDAVRRFASEVRAGAFPTAEHSYGQGGPKAGDARGA